MDHAAERIGNLHQELLNKIESKLSVDQVLWLKRTEVIYNKKLRTSLGRAYLHFNRIELNPTLLDLHPGEMESTFAHELAHLVAPLLFGRRGCAHQAGWRQVMQDFGYPPERTHRLPVGGLRYQHRVVAKGICGCKDLIHEIKPIRFRKMRYGHRRYRCLKCREELRLVSGS